MKPTDEISVRIIKGIDGADCDIDVPLEATIRDVIEGLLAANFLESNNGSTGYNFYRRESDGGISFDVKYSDQSKRIKECGWKNGDVFVVAYEALYGCPFAKEVPGIVPDCMLINWLGYNISEW